MPTITFESADGATEVTVEAPAGTALADLCDDNRAPIPFSCRSASCATCHIEVLEGQELLAEAEDEELDVLDALATPPPRHRLTCCAKLGASDGKVRVRAQNDW